MITALIKSTHHVIPSCPCMSHLPEDVAGEVAVGDVLEVALVARLVVDDLHVAVLVHPQSTHDDVVHRGGHLPPREVVA